MPQQAVSEQPYRMSEPAKKGCRSIGYGLSVLFGFLTGGFSSLVGSIVLSLTAAYSGMKAAINMYKSFSEKYKEKGGSYFGRGLSYLGRSFGTITVPWLQGIVSLLSGGERIRRNELLPYDYPDIEQFEEKLKESEDAQEVEKQENSEQQANNS